MRWHYIPSINALVFLHSSHHQPIFSFENHNERWPRFSGIEKLVLVNRVHFLQIIFYPFEKFSMIIPAEIKICDQFKRNNDWTISFGVTIVDFFSRHIERHSFTVRAKPFYLFLKRPRVLSRLSTILTQVVFVIAIFIAQYIIYYILLRLRFKNNILWTSSYTIDLLGC